MFFLFLSERLLHLCDLSFGSLTFHIFAPKIWNSLPLHIRQWQSLSTFRRQPTYPTPSAHFPMCPDSNYADFGAIYIIYLLI